MNTVKNILGRIFLVYAMVIFIITMLVVFIPIWLVSLLPEPKRAKALQPIFKVWMGTFLTIVFIPVRRKGKQHFAKGENYVKSNFVWSNDIAKIAKNLKKVDKTLNGSIVENLAKHLLKAKI